MALFNWAEKSSVGPLASKNQQFINTLFPQYVFFQKKIKSSLNLGLREMEIEGDSRSVIRKLEEKEDRSDIAVFIHDSKNLFLDFQTCIFLFTNREANEVAHIVASEGIKRRESTYLANQVHSGAAEMVAEDRRRTESMRELRRRRAGDEEENIL
ncbi:hypothetical protein PVK06_010105 [Gossypium arboreum]|uniref:RNase H type-1 domain-containing protein n=1 Tax=Gossypium arboreum TaxID=29729 RepID=A0ABR0QPD3_GOSAR|nr:hypothetical protein PVK06_010105 [Gossypium arboreum]